MNELTKTQMIVIYDRMVRFDHELTATAYYLADCNQKEIDRFLNQNKSTAKEFINFFYG